MVISVLESRCFLLVLFRRSPPPALPAAKGRRLVGGAVQSVAVPWDLLVQDHTDLEAHK